MYIRNIMQWQQDMVWSGYINFLMASHLPTEDWDIYYSCKNSNIVYNKHSIPKSQPVLSMTLTDPPSQKGQATWVKRSKVLTDRSMPAVREFQRLPDKSNVWSKYAEVGQD